MSGLRDRLRSIATRPPEQACEAAAPTCHKTENFFDIQADFSDQEMRLLGGYGASPLFIDTETTGLMGGAGTLAILVGVGKMEAGRLRVSQYYLSDYDQEEDMLKQLEQELLASDVLVTYNGKSFDVPLLRSRFVMARRNPKPLDLPHIDLLHGARRVYKKRLYSCTLTDIECQVLGIEREHDLPGKLVPEYWFRYVKTGDPEPMREILAHNEQDIVSLALLLDKLCRAYQDPSALRHRQDVLSVGRAMERMGEQGRAACYYEAAGSGEALMALGVLNKRLRRYGEAADALERAARENGSVDAMIELAKLEEHRTKDFVRALFWTDRALAAAQSAQQVEDLIKRRRRVSAKMEENR